VARHQDIWFEITDSRGLEKKSLCLEIHIKDTTLSGSVWRGNLVAIDRTYGQHTFLDFRCVEERFSLVVVMFTENVVLELNSSS
jgi:hypothetical protein